MRESAIEKAICAHAKKMGVLTYKLSGPNDRGKPDRLFAKGGKVIFMELKATGEEPKPLQWRALKELREIGCFAEWTDSISQGIFWLEQQFSEPK